MPSVGKFAPGLFSCSAADSIQYLVVAWNTCVDLFSLRLFSNMAPKLKTQMKPATKTTIAKERNRTQLPSDLNSYEDESGRQLQDMMDALAIITTHLSIAEEILAKATRLARKVSPPENPTTRVDQSSQGTAIHPSDIHSSPDYGALLDQEKQVRARLMERRRGVPTGNFPHDPHPPASQQVEQRRKQSVGSSEQLTIQ